MHKDWRGKGEHFLNDGRKNYPPCRSTTLPIHSLPVPGQSALMLPDNVDITPLLYTSSTPAFRDRQTQFLPRKQICQYITYKANHNDGLSLNNSDLFSEILRDLQINYCQ